MKELKSIFWVLVLIAGGFMLYKTLPAYWGNFKVNQMISDEAIYYTNFPKSDEAIAAAVSQKAQELSRADRSRAGDRGSLRRRPDDRRRLQRPHRFSRPSLRLEL